MKAGEYTNIGLAAKMQSNLQEMIARGKFENIFNFSECRREDIYTEIRRSKRHRRGAIGIWKSNLKKDESITCLLALTYG